MTDHSVTNDQQAPADQARWRRAPEERPAQILEAALEVFGEHGLAAARLDDIAKKAGLSKGTIYLYFESKEALFREAVQQTVVAYLALAEERFATDSNTASEQLAHYFARWWDMLRTPAYATIHRMVHSELHRFPDLHQYYAEQVVRRAHALINAVIRRGIERGEFRDIDPDDATRMSISVFLSHALWRNQVRPLMRDLPPDQTLVAQCTDFVLHALRPVAILAAVALAAFAPRTATAQSTAAISARTPAAVISLSIGDAVRLAAKQNFGAIAARARIDQADARATQARGALLPQLSGQAIDGERTFNSASLGISVPSAPGQPALFPPNGKVLGPVRNYDLRARASVMLFDLTALARLGSARASVEQSGAEAENTTQLIQAATAGTYLRVIRAERLVTARIADSTFTDEIVGIAKDQVKAGVGVAVDITRAESQRAFTRAQLISARNERDRARLDLQRILSLPLDAAVVLTDTLSGPRDADIIPEPSATARAFTQRADLKAVTSQLLVVRRGLNAASAEYFPTVALAGDYGTTGVTTSRLLPTYQWGLVLTVPFFDGLRREGRAAEARATLRELTAREKDLKDQVGIEVRGAILDVSSAREQVDAAQQRLRLSEQELSQTRERLTAGVSGNTEVITASLNLNAARTQYVDALTQYQSARIALLRVQGAITDLK